MTTAKDQEPLTPAQELMLADVRQYGVRTYNGRARLVVEALKLRDLVTVEYDLNPEKFTVRPVGTRFRITMDVEITAPVNLTDPFARSTIFEGFAEHIKNRGVRISSWDTPYGPASSELRFETIALEP